jgi:hypothetical protein
VRTEAECLGRDGFFVVGQGCNGVSCLPPTQTPTAVRTRTARAT